MDKELLWVPFYTELAKALLKYKSDRISLVDFIYYELCKVGEKSLVDYIHMEDGSKVKDIDPFSVFAIFNRNLKWANRIEFLQKFKDFLHLSVEIPTSFYGIPTVDSRRAFFFDWYDNGKRIYDLWELFEKVILESDISLIFNKVINDGLPRNSLTMILYWIAPHRFVSLDSRNRSYLNTLGFPDNYPNLNYTEYTKLLNDVRQKMNDHSIPCSSFPELSYKAWILGQTERIWMYNHFDDALSKNFIGMGSSAKGKLVFSSYDSEDNLVKAYQEVVGNKDTSIPDMYWKLMKEVKIGDVVVVFDSKGKGKSLYHELYGWGVITSDVIYDYDDDNPIHRNVEWHLPLPQIPIQENRTKNTRFLHEVKGIDAANIIQLLGINKEGESTMVKSYIDNYIQLLKSNKNLILTGAPGTGKTYMAKEIAKRILNVDDNKSLQNDKRFGFVQFHPSYDYTDFVEGLRPIQDQNGTIGFKRQDGVFKEFCKQAIFSDSTDSDTMEFINNNPTVWKVSLGGTGDNPTRKDCLDHDYIRIGWHEYGDVEDFNDYNNYHSGGKNVLKAFQNGMKIGDIVVSCYSAKEIDAVGVITGDYEYRDEGGEYPRYRTVKWLVKNIRENIIELNKNKPFTLPTVYKASITAEAALKIVQKYSSNSSVGNSPAVFVIDEINRGELSKIFGELFFSIDPGYRGSTGRVKTQYQNLIEDNDAFKDGFYVPDNVYIIGTMNDIDRSVESMDFAMRRRFAWKEVTAEESMQMLDGIPNEQALKEHMINLNEAILKTPGLGKAYQIGAAYFKKIENYNGNIEMLWNFHLKGLLAEYLRGNQNAEKQLEDLKKAYYNDTTKHGATDSDN